MTHDQLADVQYPAVARLLPVQARSFRQILQTVHLWAGLILCLPMILIGLSGSFLLAQREILYLTAPAAKTGAMQSYARIASAAETAVAPGLKASWIDFPNAQGRPASVQFVVSRRPQRTTQVLVDPVTLDILGSSELVRRGPIMAVAVNIHEFLMMPDRIGLPTVGWTAVAMTLMALSGFVLWWPRKGRWKSAFLVRRGARGIRLHLDLHHAIGIWGLLIFLILSLSGIYLAFPQSVSSGIRSLFPADLAAASAGPSSFPHAWPADPNEAVTMALALVPNTRATGMQLPNAPGRPYTVQLETIGLAPSIPPITVTFDHEKDERVYIDDPRTYSLASRTLNVAYAMHFSIGMGGLWTFLVFLGGLLPLVLAITGTTIWWKKRQARLRMS